MEKQIEMDEIDIRRYLARMLRTLRWTWLPVVILSLVFGGWRCFQAFRSFRPQYESKAVLSVSTGYMTNDVFYTSNYYDTNAAEQIVQTFPHLLGTEFMQDLIMAELDSGSIPGSVSARSIAETNMFELRCVGTDPEKLSAVLNAVIAAYPKASVYMVDNTHIQVISPPSEPGGPINSFSGRSVFVRNTGTALAAGLVVTFLLSLLNQTISSEKELKEAVSIPLLASLPLLRVKKRRGNPEILIRASDDPALGEAIRSLRTRVRRQLDSSGGKTILLTSTVPGEGKTTTAVNLAMSLAAEGHRTVLVDADLRNQSVGRLLGSGKQATGLMTLMKHANMPLGQHLQTLEGSELRYISGASTNNRYYRLDPQALNRVLDALKVRFDYIVIDTPPCGVVSDTTLLAHYADCVLYVIRRDHAPKAQILDTLLGMHKRNVPLAGCILNGLPRSAHRYGYGYGYGKKYGYGRKSKE